jgi:biopolymer transport protein ExbD
MAHVETKAKKAPTGESVGIPRRRRRVGLRMDRTPRVDVAFLLLIFVMVTTVFRRPLAMEVNMPNPEDKVQVPMGNVMTLYIRADGSMSYDIGQMGLHDVAWEELRETLLAELDLNPELIILVKSHPDARFEKMVNMLNTFDEANMQRFSVVLMTVEDRERIGEL